MQANPHLEQVCPSCGDFDVLDPVTGWCAKCTPKNSQVTTYQVEAYLASNANHLEYHMSKGESLNQAIDSLRTDVKPTCIVCGNGMRRTANRAAVFCRQTRECRRYSRRYVYLYRERGLTKAEALAEILTELG